MKKFIIGIILAIATCVAFAMPSPQQIENALAGGNSAYARSMVNEVLQQKPNSGKAHLFNAYLLAHYDLNNTAANAELQRAITFEPALSNTPMFGRVINELDTHKQIRPTIHNVQATPTVPTTYVRSDNDRQAALYVLYGLLIVGTVMLVVVFLLRNNNKDVVIVNNVRPRDEHDPEYTETRRGLFADKKPEDITPVRSNSGLSTTIVDRAPDRRFPYSRTGNTMSSTSNPAFGAPYGKAPTQQPSALKTAAAVAGGVVAGELLMDALHNRTGHDYSQNHYGDNGGGSGGIWQDTNPSVDPVLEQESFSVGNNSSWDDNSSNDDSSSSSSSSSDDSSSSWSSSSSDSSSSSWDSSSSSDSSSSWDSGSSSSGSDW